MRFPHCVAIFHNLPWLSKTKVIYKKSQRSAVDACRNRMCKLSFRHVFTALRYNFKVNTLACENPILLLQTFAINGHINGVLHLELDKNFHSVIRIVREFPNMIKNPVADPIKLVFFAREEFPRFLLLSYVIILSQISTNLRIFGLIFLWKHCKNWGKLNQSGPQMFQQYFFGPP